MRHIDVLARPVTRAQIEASVEALIELLDRIDGDPDFEETDAEDAFVLSAEAMRLVTDFPGCPVSDPGGGNVDDECEGGDSVYNTLPIYGVDQSAGPVNEVAAHRAYMAGIYGR
jgi:hypothetical protein